ncbi:MAG: hypothetical protein LBO66_12080, partial [Deltaproteobacteria bacterium]|nr:hypothetical protein [Deltaproteobacteria bacterium]
MRFDCNLDSLLVYAWPLCLDFFLCLLLAALCARFLEQYVAAAINSQPAPWERGEAQKPRASRGLGYARALLAPFFALASAPKRRSPRSLRPAPSALEGEEGRVPLKRVLASPPSLGLAPDRARGAWPYLNGALLSGSSVCPIQGAPLQERLSPLTLAAGAPLALGASVNQPPSESGAEIWGARAWRLPSFGEEGDSVLGDPGFSGAAQDDSLRFRDSRAFLGDSSAGSLPRAGVFPLLGETSRSGELGFATAGDFPGAATRLPTIAGENLSAANAPADLALFPEKRSAPVLSLAPPASEEEKAPCSLLGLIRGRLAREGVDLNNLRLSPLKMAGAQTGQSLLELVRRAVSDSNSPAPMEEEAQEPASPPPLEDFASARLLWDQLQKESAFWRSLKDSPALSSWREGYCPEEIDAVFVGLESLALEKMEREYALARKLHPRFLLASDPARAEERLLVQEKAARILGGSGDSLTLFPSLDAGANSPRGPILATIGHEVGACPESPGGRAVLFLERNGEVPIGYLDLGPEPANIAPILGEIGRLGQALGAAKILFAGAEFRDPRLKSAAGEAPARQKRGWVGDFLRARLAKGDSPLKEGAPIALPTRSPGQERLVAFYSPGAGKALQTVLRETLPRVLKELKRFWGEKADAKARAFFQATVRRHRRRTGLKILGSLFEEARAPGGELIWKIAAEKRA